MLGTQNISPASTTNRKGQYKCWIKSVLGKDHNKRNGIIPSSRQKQGKTGWRDVCSMAQSFWNRSQTHGENSQWMPVFSMPLIDTCNTCAGNPRHSLVCSKLKPFSKPNFCANCFLQRKSLCWEPFRIHYPPAQIFTKNLQCINPKDISYFSI